MLALVGVLGGSIPFLLFFTGLQMGGPAVSSFIFRSLFIFAGIFGYLILREKPEPRDYAAGFIILAGNALLVSGEAVFGLAQLLVLAATMLWALEYTISRKLLADLAPNVVMFSRMFFGSIVLLGYLAMTGSAGEIFALSSQMIAWLLIVSLMLVAFLSSWYNTLRHLPVLKAAAILSLGGIVTVALNAFFLGAAISLSEAIGLFLVLLGALIMASIAKLIGRLSRNPLKLIR
jgi:drug/metabolite transporter (DMT)-like permease